MGSAVLQVGRFADPKESRVQISKRSDMGSEFCKGVDLLILRNCVFRFRNVLIWAAPFYKEVDLLMLRDSVFRLLNV